jgi:nitroimidazol reductase NimA-like FMN-containing flavoprotein (pyridoxamine 5'-phosphate oxidase superfamily)
MSTYPPTPRTKVRRLAKRGVYDKTQVHEILDEGFICHLGFTVGTQPYVIPTLYARSDELLYLHGSAVSRMLTTLAEGVQVCATITLVDGLVLARSAFHHSMNYRSVVVLGRARVVTDPAERLKALQTMTNHIVPQRWEELRAPHDLELKQTIVLVLPLAEVSAKVRTGPPIDDEEDYATPVWAGVVPVSTALGKPIPDARILPNAKPLDVARFAANSKGRNGQK